MASLSITQNVRCSTSGSLNTLVQPVKGSAFRTGVFDFPEVMSSDGLAMAPGSREPATGLQDLREEIRDAGRELIESQFVPP